MANSKETKVRWPAIARVLYWLAVVMLFGLAVVAAAVAGLEPDLARSAAILWLVSVPTLLVGAALMLGAPE